MIEFAGDRGWGSGWPNCQPSRIKVVTWTQPHGARLSVPIRAELAVIVPELVNRLAAARGWDYAQYGTWGYSCRPIGSTNVPSNHSWGLAVDLEAPSNPQGAHTYGTQPRNAGAVARSLLFRWGGPLDLGGGYTSGYDCMHYEFMGTVAQAAALTRTIQAAKPTGGLHMDADVKAAFNGLAGIMTGTYVMDDDNNPATPKVNIIQVIENTRAHVTAVETKLAAQDAKLDAILTKLNEGTPPA